MFIYLVWKPWTIVDPVEWHTKQELSYMGLSLIAKIVLHWTLYNGINSRSETVYNAEDEITPSQKDSTQVLGTVLSFGIGFTFVGVLLLFIARKYMLGYVFTKNGILATLKQPFLGS
jgi:hypothetical protein